MGWNLIGVKTPLFKYGKGLVILQFGNLILNLESKDLKQDWNSNQDIQYFFTYRFTYKRLSHE